MNEGATNGSVRHVRGALFRTLAFAALAGLLNFAGDAHADEAKARFMFVHSSDDLAIDTDANTLRLVKVNQQVLYFSDRPVRIAGHLAMPDYLQEWTQGEDNFGENPPNAALSVSAAAASASADGDSRSLGTDALKTPVLRYQHLKRRRCER